MIINITEEQKKIIESQGYMIIEFKLWANEAISLTHGLGYENEMYTCQLIMAFLSYKAMIGSIEKLKGAFVELADTLKSLTDTFNFDDICVESKDKYPFIRNLGGKYEIRYRKPVIYHRCRNNC